MTGLSLGRQINHPNLRTVTVIPIQIAMSWINGGKPLTTIIKTQDTY